MIPDSPILIERGEKLRAFVDTLQGKPIVYGQDDCTMMCAQWIAEITQKEFDWPFYDSEEAANRLIENAGGLVKLWEREAGRIGLRQRFGEPPNIGDVGIVETTRGQIGGIFTFGGGICIRSQKGVAAMSAWGRAFPRRNDDGTWTQIPVVVKVWALD